MDEYGKSGLIGIPENKSFKNVDDNCAGRPKWMLQYLHVEFQTIRSFNCLISLKNESSDIPRFQAQTLELVNSSSRLAGCRVLWVKIPQVFVEQNKHAVGYVI